MCKLYNNGGDSVSQSYDSKKFLLLILTVCIFYITDINGVKKIPVTPEIDDELMPDNLENDPNNNSNKIESEPKKLGK